MTASQLEIGKKYEYHYNNTGWKSVTFTFNGFSLGDKKFNTLKEAKKFLGVKNLDGLEEADVRMECAKYGPVYYLFNRRFVRGSGCDIMWDFEEVNY